METRTSFSGINTSICCITYIEALEKKIQNNNNNNPRNAGGVTRKRNLNDDNDGIDDNQPAWKASKSNVVRDGD